jgi:fructokinase
MTSTLEPQSAYGAIEAGGTKWVCAIGTGPDDIRSETRFPTTTASETLGRAVAFFQAFQRTGSLQAIGIGSFGPVDLDPGSPTYGSITSTPKPGWANTDVVGILALALGVSVAFDTDVNAAALGEYHWGAVRDCANVVYLTVGTGVGGGVLIEGRPLHGLIHPEMGHMRLPHDWRRDPFPGACPYHGDCLEGLASGPALAQRWGQPAEALSPNHPAWALQAHYLALALANLICTVSPQRIVVGGGVMAQAQLFAHVRSEVQQLLNGYVQTSAILEHIDRYIVPPALGARAGILGGIALAARSVASEHPRDSGAGR